LIFISPLWEWRRKLFALPLLLLALLLPLPASAQSNSFALWLNQVAQEAVDSGVSPATVQQALSRVTLDESVVELDQKQPETTITFDAYSRRILAPSRIDKGSELLDEHKALLREIAARYGVPPQIIVALWGIESSFGHNSGNYGVIDSLATLAYEGRRADYFRHELIDALHILDEEHGDASALRGSWAGAMGQCQFMPSTYRHYAVDYNGDGRRDIWENEADVFASIANYLAAEGWRSDLTWGREVLLLRGFPEGETGLNRQRSLSEWNQLGVRMLNGNPLPAKPLLASIIQPDGPDGRSFLVYDNFRALMRWNRSTYFATTVGLLADRIQMTEAR